MARGNEPIYSMYFTITYSVDNWYDMCCDSDGTYLDIMYVN